MEVEIAAPHDVLRSASPSRSQPVPHAAVKEPIRWPGQGARGLGLKVANPTRARAEPIKARVLPYATLRCGRPSVQTMLEGSRQGVDRCGQLGPTAGRPARRRVFVDSSVNRLPPRESAVPPCGRTGATACGRFRPNAPGSVKTLLTLNDPERFAARPPQP